MLYWADRGTTAKIECSWLDGQERKVLVSDGLGWPTGLSVDFTNNDRIYWSDSKESRIESILPSGEQRKTAVYIGDPNFLIHRSYSKRLLLLELSKTIQTFLHLSQI